MNEKTKKLCVTGVMAGVTLVATAFIRVPIPLGYASFGDAVILIASFFFGPACGALAGAIGCSLADLISGYAVWAIPTIIIKALCGIIGGASGKKSGLKSPATFICVLLSMVWMVIGYTVSGMWVGGSVAAGLSSAPGLIIEGVVNIAAFYAVSFALEKVNLKRI